MTGASALHNPVELPNINQVLRLQTERTRSRQANSFYYFRARDLISGRDIQAAENRSVENRICVWRAFFNPERRLQLPVLRVVLRT